MLKKLFVHGGFAVFIMLINACAGALLWVPFQLTALGSIHVWNMMTGGPTVIGNDGPMPVIVGASAFVIGVVLAVVANLSATWVAKELTNESTLLSRWCHIGLAIVSSVLGAYIAAPWIRSQMALLWLQPDMFQ